MQDEDIIRDLRDEWLRVSSETVEEPEEIKPNDPSPDDIPMDLIDIHVACEELGITPEQFASAFSEEAS